ncbi:T9SS type A sorting domain-containing protein [Fulvivirga sp. 29W222]|uniref:T9SS type A sorting domain-containing protein n=1 Tax=Fulvivirga marina TaxID=2494733 RepID=A0A937FXP8_9BACT|nr:T9SS type A sorting domain-containing protein [Fulvivirga marina]MBL6446923.1 T9SS type A sorting domain-containing protein [Fulvivirga marina]
MKNFIIASVLGLTMLTSTELFAQCSYTQSGNLSSTISFSSIINCPNGDVVLDNMNSNPAGDGKVIFDSDVTLNSLTVNFANGNKPVEFIIPAGVTVTITTNLTFIGQPDKGKTLTVYGTLIVGNTLDFGSVQFEIDGTGTIDASAIIGADAVTCSGPQSDGTCPLVTAGSCDDGGNGFCGADVLPIVLTYFDSKSTNHGVELKWGTASEENNDYFTIERSANGSHFEKITTVSGAGTHTGNLDYTYFDKSPLKGRSYYRLSQTDFDGTTVYFDILAVDYTTVKEVSVYPNPANILDMLTIQTGADSDEDIELSIYGSTGELLKSEVVHGSGAVTIQNDLCAGFYTLQVRSGQVVISTRLVVQ